MATWISEATIAAVLECVASSRRAIRSAHVAEFTGFSYKTVSLALKLLHERGQVTRQRASQTERARSRGLPEFSSSYQAHYLYRAASPGPERVVDALPGDPD